VLALREERKYDAVLDTKRDRCSPSHMVKPVALEEYEKSQKQMTDRECIEALIGPGGPSASTLLEKTAEILNSRGQERDKDEGERTIPQLVTVFNALTGHNLSNEDGWIFMLLLKLVRMRGGVHKDDDYLDAIGYSALLAEQAIRNR
jgi:hypothetical protein